MRKVNGGDIAKNSLKKYWFGYTDDCEFSDIVEYIEINDSIFSMNEEGTMYVHFPKKGIANIGDDWYMIDAFPRKKALTVYDFIEDYYCLDEEPLDAFTFYFTE